MSQFAEVGSCDLNLLSIMSERICYPGKTKKLCGMSVKCIRRYRWLQVLILFPGLVCSTFANGFDIDFQQDESGGHPAAAAVSDGPDYPVRVADTTSTPPSPFGPTGNRSLMLENNSSENTPNVRFQTENGINSGILTLEFQLVNELSPDTGNFTNPQLQLFAGGNAGNAFSVFIRDRRWVRVVDASGTHTLNHVARVNEPNSLSIKFDAESGRFSLYLNGLPLHSRDGNTGDFKMVHPQQLIDRVAIRPGSSSVSGSRVFINRIALADAGTIDIQLPAGANLLPNSDFTASDEPRQVYPIIGDYRHLAGDDWTLDFSRAYHGDRSLRMTGDSAYFWQVLNRDSLESVFSVYLKADEPGQQVELGFEKLAFNNEGRAFAEGHTRITVEVGTEWQRHILAAEVDPKRPASFVGMHLFRVWVRPLNGGPVWVDAAQLERGRLEPLQYNPDRGDNEPGLASYRVPDRVSGVVELRARRDKPSAKGEIELSVVDTIGLDRIDEPVWGGIPFPSGVLFDPDLVRLYDEAGNQVPVQTDVLAFWPRDGSIRSLLVDFQYSVEANQSRDLRLVYGEPADKRHPPLARRENGKIRVDTGVLQFSVDQENFRWFEWLGTNGQKHYPDERDGIRIIDLHSQPFDAAWGPACEVSLELNGPNRAVIYVRGKHYDKGGNDTLLEYEARIHAFAGKNMLYVEYTVENAEAALNTAVQSIRLALPRMGNHGSGGSFGGPEGELLTFGTTANSVVSLTQLHEYSGRGEYMLYFENPYAGTADTMAGRAPGWVEAGGSAIAVHDFWQLNPGQLAVRDKSIDFFLWPERRVAYLDLPFGMSNTVHFAYAPDEAVALNGNQPLLRNRIRGDTLGASPLLLRTDPEWTGRSGVFGHFLSSPETLESYPRFDRHLDAFFDLMKSDREALDLTGRWDYGDLGDPRRWANNEHTISRNLWLQYLRTGDPEIFRRAWIFTRHFRDVDIAYAARGSRHVDHHSGGIHTPQLYGRGHYWISGVIWHYLITGDRRSLRVATEAGAHPVMEMRSQRDGRRLSRLLYHSAELYQLTQLDLFRQAFESQYAFEHPFGLSDYHTGKALMALALWYESTGEAQYYQRMIETADLYLEHHAHRAPQPLGSGRDWTIFDGLAEVARLTGERRYVDALTNYLLWYSIGEDTSEHNMVRGTTWLRQAKSFGIDEPEGLPDRTLGINLLRGSADILVSNPDASPLRLTAYRMNKGDRFEDAMQINATGPDGKILLDENLHGPLSGYRVIEMDQPGSIRIKMEARADGRSEFSANTPATFLNAAYPHAHAFHHVRRGRGSTAFFRFGILAPKEGDSISVRLRWDDLPAGAAMAARLETPDGRLIANERWVVPLGHGFTGGGNDFPAPATHLILPFPEEYRGEALVLRIYAFTRSGWQVEGLDIPWLAMDPEGFNNADLESLLQQLD